MNTLLSNLDLSGEKHNFWYRKFNLNELKILFLDAKGGSLSIKRHSLSKLLETKQKLDKKL